MTGSSAAFDVILAECGKFAAPGQLLRSVSTALQAEALKLVADGFRREEDPYGNPWAPLKSRKGKILQDTGRLRASWTPSGVSERGFSITSKVAYAAAQQYGATYAARSDAKERTLWQHPVTGRFVSRKTSLKLVIETKRRITFGQRRLAARPMVPDDRGMPVRWATAFARAALTVLEAP